MKDCPTCKFKSVPLSDEPCFTCAYNASLNGGQHHYYKPMSKGDKLRSFPNDKLAEFIEKIAACNEHCPMFSDCPGEFEMSHAACALRWKALLDSDSEEEDDA